MDGVTVERITLSVGSIELEIPDVRGEYRKKVVDLFAFTQRMYAAGAEAAKGGTPDANEEAARQRVKFLTFEGFGEVYPWVATEVLNRLWAKVEEVKKKGPSNTSAGTPGPSDSRPSDSAPRDTRPG